MPQFDKLLVAPINTGWVSDARPFLIPNDAFTALQNAYVYRGRVRKRFGSLLMGASQLNTRLAINIGTVGSNTIPGNASQLQIGQMFSVGNDIFTVYQLGAGVLTLSTNALATATIDSTTNPNTIVFTGEAGGSTVFYYPATPVMGITQYESGAINNHPSYAFDTQFIYLFNGTSWSRSGTAVFHGTNLNFFWATNWEGSASSAATTSPVMFVSNFYVKNLNGAIDTTDDPIWYTADGTNWTSSKFYFQPTGAPTTGPYIVNSRIILPFKNRLILLNTIESNGTNNFNYVNRCRFSWNGSPLATNGWYEPNTTDGTNLGAGAGYIDAYTEEAIISAQFIKDRLIVYFERSTWELAYTSNEILPFVWQKLNTELGSQSTFSTVPFDREVLTIGNTGVHACNGSNVARIDNKIPQTIFDLFSAKDNAPLRIAGIRDYFNELVYWSFVTTTENQSVSVFPNQVLVFNYQNGSWAKNNDCFTAFGYFEQQTDLTWAAATMQWNQFIGSWIDNIAHANERQVIAGTPEGFILRIAADISRNAPSRQITNITIPSTNSGPQYVDLNVINHNLSTATSEENSQVYVAVENTIGINLPIQTIYEVTDIIDANNITIYAPDISGTYLGGGTLALVSNIYIVTKQFNPYDKENKNVFLEKIDFYVEKTVNGQIQVDCYPSASEVSLVTAGEANDSIMGTGVLETFPYNATLYPFEQEQQRLNHSIYFQAFGTYVQVVLNMTEEQMINPDIAWSDFQLDGFCLYFSRAGRMQ